jgi:hypothetical protein
MNTNIASTHTVTTNPFRRHSSANRPARHQRRRSPTLSPAELRRIVAELLG